MREGLDALSLLQFHDTALGRANWPDDEPGAALPGVWRWIHANHRYNTLLWNEEDKARRIDVAPSEIAASKRLIDRHNQLRNDAVESIDEAILIWLCDVHCDHKARLSSETAGAMVDRLSILCLKIHHMRLQTLRSDANEEHIDSCRIKLQRLIAQRTDLAGCFDLLLCEASGGRAYFKVYRQFKMYNDPSLNPYLYGQAQGAAAP